MNAIDLIRHHHDTIERLLTALRAGTGDRHALVHEVANHIEAHTVMEDKLFYPTFETARDPEPLHEYAQDHQEVRRLLVTLLDSELDGPAFVSAVDELMAAFLSHARDDEEGHLLPLASRSLSARQLEALGYEMATLFDELMLHAPYRELRPETRRATL